MKAPMVVEVTSPSSQRMISTTAIVYNIGFAFQFVSFSFPFDVDLFVVSSLISPLLPFEITFLVDRLFSSEMPTDDECLVSYGADFGGAGGSCGGDGASNEHPDGLVSR